MKIKLIEIRDRMTMIPAMAIQTSDPDPARAWLLRRVGFTNMTGIILMRLNDQEAHSDPYDWKGGARTMPAAHEWLLQHFDEIPDGGVLDIEFIYGESAAPKVSERFEYP